MHELAVLANGQRAVFGQWVWSFLCLCPYSMEYPIDRFSMEVKRQLDVLTDSWPKIPLSRG